LVNKGIAIVSEEAVIMDLEKYNLGVWVLLRKDGTVLYSAKDIALAKRKCNDYKLDKSIIITADEQNLHFQQLIKTLELMNFPKKHIFSHIGYAVVRLPHGKMSSRTGDNILYSNFESGVFEFAKEGILKKWSKLSKKELEIRALKITMASIKYAMLNQSSNKVIIFDKEKAIQFEGNTGPYLQYSYARASSIIKKSKSKKSLVITENFTKEELQLLAQIAKFPQTVENSARNMNPAIIANYAHELSQYFNEFYHANPVIGAKEESFRLKLINAFKITLKNSLYLLGIEVMEEM
jgi:arginyl-tRNA synthetase